MTGPEAPKLGRTGSRFGKYFADKGWAHLLLLTGVAIFLFPFLWMVGMSLKTDDEAVSPSLFPDVPTFRSTSPSIRPPPPVPPAPDGADSSRWSTLVPLMKDRATTELVKRPLPVGGQFVDAAKLRDAAADRLIEKVAVPLPSKVWDAATPDGEVVKRFAADLTPEALDGALNDQLARFEIRGVEVRSNNNDIKLVCSGGDVAKKWVVESGPARLIPIDAKSTCVKYQFFAGADQAVILKYEFEFPIEPADLHKLVVSYNADDSWHHADETLDVGDVHWKSKQTTYLAQYRPATLTLQPLGFDDNTYRPKTWITLDCPKDLPKTTGRHATLRLTLHPSSTGGAIAGKIQRNYIRAFQAVPFWTYFGNSVLLVALQMAGALFSASFVAYAFARLNWPGRSFAFGLLLATMMLPGQVTMIPGFVIWRTLGWYNTLNPLWITSWFGSAFFIFLMTQFMKTIPKELEEAARIDGLNAVQTWWYIILPLVKPTLAAIAIMVFMGAWNEFMGPLIMLRDQGRFPLGLGLYSMNVDQGADTTLVMAGNMIMTLPVILIFFLFQRYFIEGVTVSGMKG